MRQAFRIAMWFTLLGLAIAGCGNKGDLVLPDKSDPAETAATP